MNRICSRLNGICEKKETNKYPSDTNKHIKPVTYTSKELIVEEAEGDLYPKHTSRVNTHSAARHTKITGKWNKKTTSTIDEESSLM